MAQRRPALISFLDATERLQQLPSPVPGFARLIGEDARSNSEPSLSFSQAC